MTEPTTPEEGGPGVPSPETDGKNRELPEGLNPDEWLIADGVQCKNGWVHETMEERDRRLGGDEAVKDVGFFDQSGGLLAFCSREEGSRGKIYVGPVTEEAKGALRAAGYKFAGDHSTSLVVPFSVNNTNEQPKDPEVAAKLEQIHAVTDAARVTAEQDELNRRMMEQVDGDS